MTRPDYLEFLRGAFAVVHGCMATWREAIPVRDELDGVKGWEGVVEVFDLTGHGAASVGYAWAYESPEGWQAVTVLGLPPVVDARSAVRVSVLAGAASN